MNARTAIWGLAILLAAGSARAEGATIAESDLELTPAVAGTAAETPTDWTKPYAVLGRGVKNRKTDAILQLACKDEPAKNAEGELQCSEVQFVEIALSGNVTEVGRPLKLGADFRSTRDFKRLLKDRVKDLKRAGELPGRGLFSSTKNWFSSGASAGTKAWPILLGAGLGTIALSGGAPVLGVVGLTLFGAFPIGIDVILIPLGLSVNAIKGDYFIGTKTLSVYGWVKDRDPKYWQFKPRAMSNKNYERFKAIVTATPKRVLRVARVGNEGGDGRHTDFVEVEYKDGRVEKIRNPSNLVIYGKGERREYGPDGREN